MIGVPDDEWGESVIASWSCHRAGVGRRAARALPGATRELQVPAPDRVRRRAGRRPVRQGAQARAARTVLGTHATTDLRTRHLHEMGGTMTPRSRRAKRTTFLFGVAVVTAALAARRCTHHAGRRGDGQAAPGRGQAGRRDRHRHERRRSTIRGATHDNPLLRRVRAVRLDDRRWRADLREAVEGRAPTTAARRLPGVTQGHGHRRRGRPERHSSSRARRSRPVPTPVQRDRPARRAARTRTRCTTTCCRS